jgi:hypothetical protein
MNKEFTPYEEALALKELGFNEPCLGCFENDEEDSFYLFEKGFIENTNDYYDEEVCAPLYQQAFRWFREKYQLHNGIYPYYDEYEFQIKDFRLPTNIPINGGLMKYEEAELACLKKLIEIVKTTKIDRESYE